MEKNKNTQTKSLVKKYNFKFSKRLGQNFLTDDTVLKDILEGAEITKDDYVIEIGPGVGTLTKELLLRAKEVCSIELDSELIPILEEELKEFKNFKLVHNDVLKVDIDEIIGEEKSVKVVANLPYYVTTPIIIKLIKSGSRFKSITVMVQKEVGERITAKANCKEYGALSLFVNYYCTSKIIRKVSPNAFIPQPKVESVVIRLDKLEQPAVKVKDEELFFMVIRDAFNTRRKTLWNSLKALKLDSQKLEEAFRVSGIDPGRRGETLTIEEYAKLSDCIKELM